MRKLKFKKAEEEINVLIKVINDKIRGIDNREVDSIIKEFQSKINDLQKKIKLEIAFVGQYSAGKSTIISAITGNRDIKIGQDITTDTPQAYPWGNVILIDTPGIYAGRPEHDKISIDYMNRADLLVYVITTQGFSSETAKNFRRLAFEENRIDKMMLVINKSSQGNKEEALRNWISDALKVTEPKTENDLYLCVIDAKDYLEALDIDDPDDKQELIKYSGFNDFLDNLDKFIANKGILGRLITPINLIQDYLNRIINQLTADNEDTKNLLELLRRKYFRLIESKKNITNVVNAHIEQLVSDIKKEGNKIANLIEKDSSKDILEMESNNSIEIIEELVDNTNKKIEYAIESEFTKLHTELDILMQSELAQMLIIKKESIKINFNTNIEIKGINKTKIESGIDILKNIGNFAENFAINDEAVSAGAKGLKAVSGSDAHKTIYNIGKFFGYKFKPYEAVGYADKIAKFGKAVSDVVGKIAIALPFLTAAYEEYAESKYDEKIKEERQKIRRSYDNIANDIKKSFQNQFNKLIHETYDIELENTQKIIEGIRSKNKLKDEKVQELQELLHKSNKILKDLNTGTVMKL